MSRVERWVISFSRSLDSFGRALFQHGRCGVLKDMLKFLSLKLDLEGIEEA